MDAETSCPVVIFDSSMTERSGSLAAMKTALLIAGIAAVAMGLLWVGQGTGLVHWPASSFMLDQGEWATRGALLAAAGLVLIALARRR